MRMHCGMKNAWVALVVGITTFGAISAGARVIYVDADVNTPGDGTSWATAYRSLQDGLSEATDGDEVWVAKGTYRPDEGAGWSAGDRASTFMVPGGMRLLGGYAGGHAPDPNERPWPRYGTILSGDLQRNDQAGSGRQDNSYHVVTVYGEGTAVLEGLIIRGGYADDKVNAAFGGGILVADGNVELRECLIEDNYAFFGAGVSTSGNSVSLDRCVFRSNQTLFIYSPRGSTGGKGGGLYCRSTVVTAVNCLFEGNRADDYGGAMYCCDGAEVRLLHCTMTGNGAAFGGSVALDSRAVAACTLEAANCIFWDQNNALGVLDQANISVNHSCVRGGWTGNEIVVADPKFVKSAWEIFELHGDSPCVDAGDNEAVPTEVEVDLGGRRRLLGENVDLGCYEYVPGRVVYVDGRATGAQDGTRWQDAMNSLQDALQVVPRGNEIHVAQGTYTPDVGREVSRRDRLACFQLVDNVAVRGGYAGLGAIDPNERDIERYETILSGDLCANDPDFLDFRDRRRPWPPNPLFLDNAEVIVRGSGITRTAVLDGFTMKWAYAGSPKGAMMNSGASPTVMDCTFAENASVQGAALANYDGSHPAVLKCRFIHNVSGMGSAILNKNDSNPEVTDCLFLENFADGSGGAIANWGGSPLLTNCVFERNEATHNGAAVATGPGSPVMINCVFAENSAARSGGALSFWRYLDEPACDAVVVNCTFVANEATSARAIFCDIHSQSFPTSARAVNCIFWDGGDEVVAVGSSTVEITYSTVQGGFTGVGNVSFDPGFAFEGDWRLRPGSPCIDAGTSAVGVNLPVTDIEGRPRVLDGNGDSHAVIDMGAVEFDPGIRPVIVALPPRLDCVNNPDDDPDQSWVLHIAGSGGGTLEWEIQEDCPWLEVSPASGVSDGQTNEITLRTNTAGLAVGTRQTLLTVADQNDPSNRITVPISISINKRQVRVPDDLSTIQDAIDHTVDGGQVLLSRGIHKGQGNHRLDFKGKAISVCGEGRPGDCVIDCERLGRGFCFHNGEGPDSVLENLTICGAIDQRGAAIYCREAGPTIRHCILAGNEAREIGGAFCVDYSDVRFIHCTMVGNRTGQEGGAGACINSARAYFENCIFTANVAPSGDHLSLGAGGFNKPNTAAVMYYTAMDRPATRITMPSKGATLVWDEGNIDSTAEFADAGYWDPMGTPNDTNDDLFVLGDYHQRSEAGRWDANAGRWVYDPTTSDGIDAGSPSVPYAEEVWPHGFRVNMGAYGATNEASLSNDSTGHAVDLNWDGFVTNQDVALFMRAWLEQDLLHRQDFNCDDIVDFGDFAMLIEAWTDTVTPGQAHDPSPPSGTLTIHCQATLLWQAGEDTVSHDVYFGIGSTPTFRCNQKTTWLTVDNLVPDTVYFWRVDEVGPTGTTTGPLWWFRTTSEGCR